MSSRDTAQKRLRRELETRDRDRPQSRSERRRLLAAQGPGTASSRLKAAPPAADEQTEADTAFRRNILAIYLRNKLFAKDTASLIRDAEASGAKSVADLAAAGGPAAIPRSTSEI